MNTQAQAEEKAVNFLDFTQKKQDMRFNFSDQGNQQRKVIHWIGVINLDNFDFKKGTMQIMFFDSNRQELKIDSFYQRYADGAIQEPATLMPYEYSCFDKEAKNTFLAAKNKGEKYFYILIQEDFQINGINSASMLIDLESDYPYGVATSREFLESFDIICGLGHFVFSESIRGCIIRSEHSYVWMK